MSHNPPISICRINRNTASMERVAYLPHAYEIGYTLKRNDVSTCSFSIPLNAPGAEYLTPTALIEIQDNGEQIGLFKVATRQRIKNADGVLLKVTANHVISTLQEKVMFSLHEFTGLPIAETINGILGTAERDEEPSKQSDWVLGACTFTQKIDYLFENVTLLDALFSIPKNWQSEYQWTFDTTVYPWKLNLIQPSDEITCEIRNGKNLIEVQIDEDYQQLRNKIYALGKGEGINQLNILYAEDLESPDTPRNGEYYIQDNSSVERYGEVYEGIYTDRSIERQPLLLQAAKKYLAEYAGDHPTYTVKAADIYQQSGISLDHFTVGAMCRIVDRELGIETTVRILEIEKTDMIDQPWNVRLTAGKPGYDLIDMLQEFKHNDHVSGTTAQGATNIYPYSFSDNCDPSHPLTLDFVLPDDLVYINKCDLYCTVENFRAYEQGAASGGGTTTMGGSLTTTQNSDQATTVGGTLTTTASQTIPSATAENNYVPPVTSDTEGFPQTMWSSLEVDHYDYTSGIPVHVLPTNGHYHDIPRHVHPPHTHPVTIPSHAHSISPHQHTVPAHAHGIAQHQHTVPTHTHDLNYGIYEKPCSGEYTGIQVYVDETHLRTYIPTNNTPLDLITLLRNAGKSFGKGIHTLKLVPVSSGGGSGLVRIRGSIFVQCFIQSRGSYQI